MDKVSLAWPSTQDDSNSWCILYWPVQTHSDYDVFSLIGIMVPHSLYRVQWPSQTWNPLPLPMRRQYHWRHVSMRFIVPHRRAEVVLLAKHLVLKFKEENTIFYFPVCLQQVQGQATWRLALRTWLGLQTRRTESERRRREPGDRLERRESRRRHDAYNRYCNKHVTPINMLLQ